MIGQIRRAAQSLVHVRARDVTTDTAGRSALVIAPHPDDETLGCGATILHKVAAGSAVTVLLVTDGRNSHAGIDPDVQGELRRAEMAEAGLRLGLTESRLIWAGLEDGNVAADEDKLEALITRLLAELKPDEVYATCAAEPHPDHAAVGRAARRACTKAGVPLLEYPIWLWATWPLQRGDRVGSIVDSLRRKVVQVSQAGVRDRKSHALSAHASQLSKPEAAGDGEWQTLPPSVLHAARQRSEIFFRGIACCPMLEIFSDVVVYV